MRATRGGPATLPPSRSFPPAGNVPRDLARVSEAGTKQTPKLLQLITKVEELENELDRERKERSAEADLMGEMLVRVSQAEHRAKVAEERVSAAADDGRSDRAGVLEARARLADAETRADDAEARLADAESAAAEHLESAEKSEELATTLAAQLTEAEDEIVTLRRAVDAGRRESARAASVNPAELEAERERASELEAKLREETEQRARIASEHAAAMAKVTKEQQARIALLAEEHARHVGRLEEDRSAQVVRIELKHGAELEALRVKHESALLKLREDKDASVAKAREERDTAVSRVQQERYETFAKLRVEKEEAVGGVREETDRLVTTLRQERDDAIADLAQKESALERLKKDHETLSKRLMSAISDRERLAGELAQHGRQIESGVTRSSFVGAHPLTSGGPLDSSDDGPIVEVEDISDLVEMLDRAPSRATARPTGGSNAAVQQQEDDPPTRPRGPSPLKPKAK